MACFDRALAVDTAGVLSFGTTTPVLFFSRLLDPPVRREQGVDAIHFYDPVTFTLLAGNRLTPGSTPSFARMDGVRFAAPTFGLARGQVLRRQLPGEQQLVPALADQGRRAR